MNLRKRKQESSPEIEGGSEKNITKPKKTQAQIQTEYRQRLKVDPDRYQKQKELDQMRCKLWRLSRTEEQIEHDKELAKERSRRYRERKKSLGCGTSSTVSKRTRKSSQAQAQKWRDDKRQQRASLSAQKRRRVNEKRRHTYAEKRSMENASSQKQSDSSFTTRNAKHKAVSRSWRVLPRCPEKFAEVVSSVVAKSTPRKKAALKRRLVLSPNEKYSIKDVIREIRTKRSSKYTMLRRLLHDATVAKKKIKKAAARKHLGLSWDFLTKQSQMPDSRKTRKNALDEGTKDAVNAFFSRVDISRELPCRAQKGSSKRVLECSLKNAHQMFLEENPSVKIALSTFCKLKPKNVKIMASTKLLQCMCEYCVNVTFLLESLWKKQQSQKRSKYDAVKETLCQTSGFPRRDCIERTCTSCGVWKLEDALKPFIEECGKEEIKWKDWGRNEAGRMAIVEKVGSTLELVTTLLQKLVPLAKHLSNATWQGQQFNFIKENVPEKWVVMCLDFGENYNCHHQDEAQSSHWSYNQATIHPVVAYYKCQSSDCEKKSMCRESIIFITDDRKHDQHAVHHFTQVANAHLRSSGVQIQHEIHFSDGAGAQYKSKLNFADMSCAREDHNLTMEKHFFGSRHGKGPCDGEIGVVKRTAANAVKSRQCIIDNAQDFYREMKARLTVPMANEVQHTHNKRIFIFVKGDEINRERRGENLKPVKDTRKKHCFTSTKPFLVVSRERSCFCDTCRDAAGTSTETCPNVDITGTWELSRLLGQVRARTRKDPSIPSSTSTASNSLPGLAEEEGLHVAEEEGLSEEEESPESPRPGTSENHIHSVSELEIQTGVFVVALLKGKRLVTSAFFAEVLEQCGEEVHLRYMKRCHHDLFMWPSVEDSSWEPSSSILCKVDFPELANKWEQFRFSCGEMERIKSLLPHSVYLA